MSNLNQKIYFLSLQKFLAFDEIISFLHMNKQDVVQLTEKYFRKYCSEQESYFDEIIAKKFVLMPEVLNFIFLNKDNKKFKINNILKEFQVEKSYLINFLYYLVKIQPKLAYILYLNDSFYSEVKEEINRMAVKRVLTNVKLFRNSEERTSLLLKYAQDKSIEEISLIFACSPYVVEEELIYLGKGGFWNNENIRASYPFFIGSSNKKFSKAEIIYLINNRFLEKEILAKRVKVNLKNLNGFFKIFESIELKEETIIKFIQSNDFFLSNEWLKVNILLNLEKDNNKYLSNYPFRNLFEDKEIKSFEELKETFSTKIENINKKLEEIEHSNYLFVTYSNEKYVGKIVNRNELYTSIKESSHKKIKLLNNSEILFYKKLKT